MSGSRPPRKEEGPPAAPGRERGGWTRPALLALALLLLGAPFPFPALEGGWVRVLLLLVPAWAALMGGTALALRASLLRRKAAPGEEERLPSWFLPLHLSSFFALGWCVKAVAGTWPPAPLAFFLLFLASSSLRPREEWSDITFRTFWRRPEILWLPALALALPALGRLLGEGRADLLWWSAAFLPFALAVALAGGWRHYEGRYVLVRRKFSDLIHDVKDLDSKVREGTPLEQVELAAAGKKEALRTSMIIKQDDILHAFLLLACDFFAARTGILFVNDGLGAWRMRAAAIPRGAGRDASLEHGHPLLKMVQGGSGYLCKGDLAVAGPRFAQLFPFYREPVPVRSLLCRSFSPWWDRESRAQALAPAEQLRPALLYLDSSEPDFFGDDDETRHQLDRIALALGHTLNHFEILFKETQDLDFFEVQRSHARSLTQTLDPVRIADLTVQSLMMLSSKLEEGHRFEGAAVVLGGGAETARVAAAAGFFAPLRGKEISTRERSRAALALASGNALPWREGMGVLDSLFFHGERLGEVGSFDVCPMVMQGEGGKRVMGALAVGWRRPSPWDQAHPRLLTLAEMTAPALDNAFKHKEVEDLSRIDPLTGLYNRRTFSAALEERFKEAQRTGVPFLLMLLDLDHFKKVNDTYGHSVGDEVLRETSRRFRENAREVDRVGRYGGEEFLAFFPAVGTAADAAKVAEKYRRAIGGAPIVTSAGPLHRSVSIGYVLFHQGDKVTIQELVDRADQALYKAKETGRDRHVGWHEIASLPAPPAS